MASEVYSTWETKDLLTARRELIRDYQGTPRDSEWRKIISDQIDAIEREIWKRRSK